MFSRSVWRALALHLDLSGRELSILQAIFDNQVEFGIAHDLGISTHTVHTHIERLHRKLHVTSRTQLVVEIVARFLRLTESADGGLPPVCARRLAGQCPFGPASRN